MPILSVKDVEKSTEFFTEGLGFIKAGQWDNDDGSVNFSIVVMDTITLGLMRDQNASGTGDNWAAYLYIEDIDAFQDQISNNGIIPTGEIIDQPYGCRELEIMDIDDNRICFGQDLSPTEAGPGL